MSGPPVVSWSTMRKIELIFVASETVTSMPYDLPGMFPNRLAWPPDLPMTMFWPFWRGGFVELYWLLLEPLFGTRLGTVVPGSAICSFRAVVRSTASFTFGAVTPFGPKPDGNGLGLPPRALLSPGFLLATSWSIESTPGDSGRKPATVLGTFARVE